VKEKKTDDRGRPIKRAKPRFGAQKAMLEKAKAKKANKVLERLRAEGIVV
jgi:hypothetical protein